MPFGATKELIMNILDSQISAQIENRIDVEIIYTQHKDMEDDIRLYEKKGIFFLCLRAVEKAISKTEYFEILEMAQEDHYGKKSIVIDQHYDWFWHKYWNFRDNDKLEKIGKSLFGNSWKKATAEALDVDERRITHWLQATRPIPDGVWVDLKSIAEKRKSEIQNSIDLLTLSTEELTKKEVKKALN